MMRRAFAYTMVVVLLVPLVVILLTSFTTLPYVSFPPAGFTLKWYAEALTKREFLQSFYLSSGVAALTAIIATVLGLPVAVGIVRYRLPGRELVNAFSRHL
jgi:putative spermidine/putrescine transport system permease protein